VLLDHFHHFGFIIRIYKQRIDVSVHDLKGCLLILLLPKAVMQNLKHHDYHFIIQVAAVLELHD
jgi:hypothetical protein